MCDCVLCVSCLQIVMIQPEIFNLDDWKELFQKLMKLNPFSANNLDGVNDVSIEIQKLFELRGFNVRRISKENQKEEVRESADVLIATRAPRINGKESASGRWVGLFGHFDVELVDDYSNWLTPDPCIQTQIGDRIYARGIGDNLGPLLQRILLVSNDDIDSPGYLWILHGEEEIGSGYPHEIFPIIASDGSIPELEKICLWIEETGYFLADGTPRILTKNIDSNLEVNEKIIEYVLEILQIVTPNHRIAVQQRFLNKQFGEDKCPCLTHFVSKGKAPYVAFGPNDVETRIHDSNESLLISNIYLAANQF
ncbi:hypothetical protein HK096_000616, partial [Nowakowskiella sp. JEL0078]